MSQRTWFITGVSSGFGRQLLISSLRRLRRRNVRDIGKVTDLLAHYPESWPRRGPGAPPTKMRRVRR